MSLSHPGAMFSFVVTPVPPVTLGIGGLVHEDVNVFNVCRHLTRARTHRLLRAEAFASWREAAGIAAEAGRRGLSSAGVKDAKADVNTREGSHDHASAQ